MNRVDLKSEKYIESAVRQGNMAIDLILQAEIQSYKQ